MEERASKQRRLLRNTMPTSLASRRAIRMAVSGLVIVSRLGSADDANQYNAPDMRIAAAGGLHCDGFSSGCQSGGSYGTSGMYNIDGHVLCMDCAIKFFGLQDDSPKERVRTLAPFLIKK